MIIFKVIREGSTWFKYIHMKFFLCFCIRKYQKVKKRVNILWFKSMSLFNHCLEPIFLFWFENKGAQLFLIWVLFWVLIWKLSCVLRGEIVVSLENNFWLIEYFEQVAKHSQNKCFYHALILSTTVHSQSSPIWVEISWIGCAI
jgi:hypothetical protein